MEEKKTTIVKKTVKSGISLGAHWRWSSAIPPGNPSGGLSFMAYLAGSMSSTLFCVIKQNRDGFFWGRTCLFTRGLPFFVSVFIVFDS